MTMAEPQNSILSPLLTLEDVLGGPYPNTARAGLWSSILSELVQHICIVNPDMDVMDLRRFFAYADPSEWLRVVGSRYPHNTIHVCSGIARAIMFSRGVL